MGIITTTQKAGYDSHVIDDAKHRLINDTGTTTTELFSASKIISDLAGKSDTTHNHTGVYEPADATILKDADIGVSVQAYDATIAKTNTLQTFTVAQRSTLTTDNDLSFDLAVTNKFKSTPTALGTLTFTNLAAQSGSIILDNTGAYAIILDTMIKAKSGLSTTLSTAGIYVIGYECDGTTVYLTSSAAMV